MCRHFLKACGQRLPFLGTSVRQAALCSWGASPFPMVSAQALKAHTGELCGVYRPHPTSI